MRPGKRRSTTRRRTRPSDSLRLTRSEYLRLTWTTASRRSATMTAKRRATSRTSRSLFSFPVSLSAPNLTAFQTSDITLRKISWTESTDASRRRTSRKSVRLCWSDVSRRRCHDRDYEHHQGDGDGRQRRPRG